MAELTLGRRLRYIAETAGVLVVYGLFRALPIDWASAAGGWIGRNLGPHLGLSRRARRNLALVMPELTPADVDRIVADMWDNLGRFAGEMPHIARLDPDGGRVEVVGLEHVRSAATEPEGCIFFSGHLANWELLPILARHHGIELESVYRAANNPWIDPDDLEHPGRRAASEGSARRKTGRRRPARRTTARSARRSEDE